MKQTLIDRIEEEMQTDDADREKQSNILKRIYKESTPEEQERMDDVTMCICGWTLSTLIGKK